MHEIGLGVEQSDELAATCYRYANSQRAMYAKSLGVNQSDELAAIYYRLCENQKQAKSMIEK